MQVIVDGMLTHYERSGKGKLVLILPGWADTSVSWLPIQKALSASYDVIVLDIPGFGGSQQPPDPWHLDDYSHFVQHFIDKLGLKDLYAIIGHSNGGAMAIHAVAGGRMQPEKLVLVASAGIRAVQKGRKSALRLLSKTGKILSKPLPARVQQKLRAKLYSAVGSDIMVAAHMEETFKNIVNEDIQSDAANISTPTVLIYGDKDDQTPLRYGEMLQKLIKNSDLVTMVGADHYVHVKQPEDLRTKIGEFLK